MARRIYKNVETGTLAIAEKVDGGLWFSPDYHVEIRFDGKRQALCGGWHEVVQTLSEEFGGVWIRRR